MFPHHEDEIAQSESANGQKFVNYWMHCEYLIVDGQKMSKSLGNFYTVRDLIAKGYTPEEIRWVLISAHYRKKLNFTFDFLKQSRETLKSFKTLFAKLHDVLKIGKEGASVTNIVHDAVEKFGNAMADDLNISEALAPVFNLQRETNKLIASNELGVKGAEAVLGAFHNFDSILGVFDFEEAEEEIPSAIKSLAEERLAARKAKDFAKSDTLRKQITDLGWAVEDKAGAYSIKKI